MQLYYTGTLLFKGRISDDEENLLLETFDSDGGDGDAIFFVEGNNTGLEFFGIVTNIDKSDLEELTAKFKDTHPLIAGVTTYSGDCDGQYFYDQKEKVWFHEEPEYPSNVSLYDLRERLNEKSLKTSTLGIPDEGYDYLLNATTDEMLTDGKDVITQISLEMFNDDENDSQKLIDLYKAADSRERAIMDAVMVCICGWTMGHIIENAPDLEDFED